MLTLDARGYPSDKLCAYIKEHPQAFPKEIAENFGVPYLAQMQHWHAKNLLNLKSDSSVQRT